MVVKSRRASDREGGPVLPGVAMSVNRWWRALAAGAGPGPGRPGLQGRGRGEVQARRPSERELAPLLDAGPAAWGWGEDFSNRHGPHRTMNQAAPLRPVPDGSPTWINSGSSGATVLEA